MRDQFVTQLRNYWMSLKTIIFCPDQELPGSLTLVKYKVPNFKKVFHPKDHWTLKTGYFEDPTPASYRFKPFHWRVQDPEGRPFWSDSITLASFRSYVAMKLMMNREQTGYTAIKIYMWDVNDINALFHHPFHWQKGLIVTLHWCE